MKWILLILGGVIGVLALAFVGGVLLPREHRASRSVVLGQPPDTVWRAIRDFAAVPAWWPELRRAERLPDSANQEVWRQDMGGFPMTLAVAEEAPPRRLVTRIMASDDAAFGGQWVYEITAADGGTRITVTEDGWIANYLFRVMANLTGLDTTIKSYLRALGRRFGEDVTPMAP